MESRKPKLGSLSKIGWKDNVKDRKREERMDRNDSNRGMKRVQKTKRGNVTKTSFSGSVFLF